MAKTEYIKRRQVVDYDHVITEEDLGMAIDAWLDAAERVTDMWERRGAEVERRIAECGATTPGARLNIWSDVQAEFEGVSNMLNTQRAEANVRRENTARILYGD